jgi:hypothetical protein
LVLHDYDNGVQPLASEETLFFGDHERQRRASGACGEADGDWLFGERGSDPEDKKDGCQRDCGSRERWASADNHAYSVSET